MKLPFSTAMTLGHNELPLNYFAVDRMYLRATWMKKQPVRNLQLGLQYVTVFDIQ